jgi:hypothetical protein
MKIRWSPNTNKEFEFEIPDDELPKSRGKHAEEERLQIIDSWVNQEFGVNVWPEWEIVDE